MFRSIWELFGQYDGTTHHFLPRTWNVTNTPAANTKATVTKTAGVKTGQRLVATSITATLCAGSSAPAANVVTIALIDGDSGGTNYLWGPVNISIPAVAGSMNGVVVPLIAIGSANTDMTLEFSAPGGANTFESVALEGTIV